MSPVVKASSKRRLSNLQAWKYEAFFISSRLTFSTNSLSKMTPDERYSLKRRLFCHLERFSALHIVIKIKLKTHQWDRCTNMNKRPRFTYYRVRYRSQLILRLLQGFRISNSRGPIAEFMVTNKSTRLSVFRGFFLHQSAAYFQ